MASDEDMAIRFYQIGNARDLANQIIAILESPELELQMAEHNFAAGVEMTMTNVVNNYLRWFRLNNAKRTLRRAGVNTGRTRFSLRNFRGRHAGPDWRIQPTLIKQDHEPAASHTPSPLTPAPAYAEAGNVPDNPPSKNSHRR